MRDVSRALPPLTRKSVDIPATVKTVRIKICGGVYSVGVLGFTKRRIGETPFVIDCKIEKLNRLIRIVGDTLTNHTTREVTVEFNGKTLTVNPQQTIPFTEASTFQIGHNPDIMAN